MFKIPPVIVRSDAGAPIVSSHVERHPRSHRTADNDADFGDDWIVRPDQRRLAGRKRQWPLAANVCFARIGAARMSRMSIVVGNAGDPVRRACQPSDAEHRVLRVPQPVGVRIA